MEAAKMQITDNESDERLLPMRHMCRRYGVSPRTIDRWLERGKLPVPVRIGPRKFWRLSQLRELERQRERKPSTSDVA
jgi:predicted DNA-binding transcriptional regulator AlpA